MEVAGPVEGRASRKLSTSAPWRLGSDHAVRLRVRNFAGIDMKASALISSGCRNGFSMGPLYAMKRPPLTAMVWPVR